ncbi:MAG: DUF6438 domain-containing protein [Bacteroidota bacterium]
MRIALSLALLLTLVWSCNRDSADPAAEQGAFLAPASAPKNAANRGALSDEQKPLEGRPMIEGPSKADLEAANEDNGGQLTEEEIAAAKRMGPGRTTPQVTAPQTRPMANNSDDPKPSQTVINANTGKPILAYDRPLFVFSKPPCRGNCPNYKITLTADRQLQLAAKDNLKKSGNYTIRLTAREYSELLAQLEDVQASNLLEVYPEDTSTIPSDAQATMLTFFDAAGTEQRMEVYFDAPEKLAAYITTFEEMVDREDWVKVGN